MPLSPPPDPPAYVAPAPATVAASTTSFPTPIDALGADLAGSFGGTNLLFYAVAVGGSAAMAFGGADESIQDAVQQRLGSRAYGNAANLTGYILPASAAAGVWLTGLALGDRSVTGAGSAAVQALAVTVFTTSVLKITLGREYPPEDAHTFTPFQSWSWPFPAWPSGHTSSTVSVVAALSAYYGSDELWVPFVGYPVALAIGMGMLSGDEHWASDLLAGAVIGQCIGWSIGRAFRARARGDTPPPVSFVPLIAPSAQGVALAVVW
jgi:membrane-associated phospholipid phosphatase